MKATIKTLDNGDKFIELLDELMAELCWQEGDDIQWTPSDDGCIHLTKVNKLGVSQSRIDSLVESGWTHSHSTIPGLGLRTLLIGTTKNTNIVASNM